MQDLFRVDPTQLARAQQQGECLRNSTASMETLEKKLKPMDAHAQRDYLERHHRGAMEKFGDLLRPLNIFSNETDAQAVTRLLRDLRGEQEQACMIRR